MARINPPYGPDEFAVEFKTLTLERMKVQSSGRIGAQLLHDVDMQVLRDGLAFMGDEIAVRFVSYVLADRLAEQKVTVPFEKTVPVESQSPIVQHAGGAPWVLFFSGALASVGSIFFPPLIIAAAVFLVTAFFTAVSPRRAHVRYSQDVTVSGKVEVDLRSYNTFPENNTVYPDSLGAPVRLQTMNTAVRYDKP